MLNAVIVDDELKSAELLRLKLQKFCPQVSVVQQFNSALKAIEYLNEHECELVFLDIEMPELNGLSVARQLNKNLNIVFVTAYEKYSIDAIRLAAFDYLLKPVDEKELIGCVQRLEEKLQHQGSNGQPAKKNNTQYDKIALPSQEGVHFFSINEIIKIEAESNYSVFYFTDRKKITVSKTLKQVEDALEAYTFFRPHKSFLINLNYIKTYVRGEGGSIVLMDGSEVEVSRSRKKEFLDLFNGL
jgi:two-component system, LytTR family, response regulator